MELRVKGSLGVKLRTLSLSESRWQSRSVGLRAWSRVVEAWREGGGSVALRSCCWSPRSSGGIARHRHEGLRLVRLCLGWGEYVTGRGLTETWRKGVVTRT